MVRFARVCLSKKVLIYELEDLGLEVKCEVPIPIVYNDIVLIVTLELIF